MSSAPNAAAELLPGVIEIIARVGSVKDLAPNQDFYDSGVTSVMALPLLLDMEDRFHVSIPDESFIAARTPQAIAELIVKLQGN